MADRTSGSPLTDPFEGTSYRALSRLGGGKTGDVYAVEHLGIGREFAAKVLHAHLAGDPRSVDRLRLEAQALGRLNHPNVVSVQSYGATLDGRPFLVMERLRGRTLARELEQRGALSVSLAASHAIALLSALEALHAVGLVHRDVNPESVFLAENRDGTVEIKLIELGLVRVLPNARADGPSALAVPTESGEVLGTPRFLSPEGAQGQRVDEAADVYGAALVLYTMLAGRGPFDHAGDGRALLEAHAQEVPAPPSRYATEPVPAELDALVLEALVKDPQARPASAREFRERLERLTALLARPAGWLETTGYFAHAAGGEHAADGAAPGARVGSRAPRDVARRSTSQRALVVMVVLGISGLIASGMAVIGAAALLSGLR
jgi:serine/threonine protein kinase